MSRRAGWWTVVLSAAVSTGCRGPTADHAVLEPDLEPLRSAFTADSGKVRAIFLASPT